MPGSHCRSSRRKRLPKWPDYLVILPWNLKRRDHLPDAASATGADVSLLPCRRQKCAAMKFEAAEIPGVYYIAAAPHVDERGFFARLYCPDEFARAGIDFNSTQTNLSRNTHAYAARHALAGRAVCGSQVVRVPRGAIYDVVIDIRPGEPDIQEWIARRLVAGTRRCAVHSRGLRARLPDARRR